MFLRVFQGLPSFSSRCRFTTWLFQVAKNRVLDELRAQERRPRVALRIDEMAPIEVGDPPIEQRETIAGLWRAVEDLDVDLKMALLLRDVVGLSHREIADALEITLATVKWRIYTGREQVLLALAEEEAAPDSAPSAVLLTKGRRQGSELSLHSRVHAASNQPATS